MPPAPPSPPSSPSSSSSSDAGEPVVRFLTRDDCTLCREARVLLEGMADELGVRVEVVDVDADPDLRRRFGHRVPVAVHGGEELFELRADARALREDLERIAAGP